jgi:hypothetical protein
MSRFEAEVLDENQPMLAVFRRSLTNAHQAGFRFNRTRLGTDVSMRPSFDSTNSHPTISSGSCD